MGLARSSQSAILSATWQGEVFLSTFMITDHLCVTFEKRCGVVKVVVFILKSIIFQ